MPCRYQPDCRTEYVDARLAPPTSWTRSPLRVLCRYSPCSLKFVRVALPFGAHFQIASAIQTRVLPLNDCANLVPAASVATRPWSVALASSIEMPARQLWLAPMSPPVCAVSATMPGPLRFESLPGYVRPRPSSTPNSTYWSIGGSHDSCTPSSPYWPPSIAWYASGLSTKSQVCECCGLR